MGEMTVYTIPGERVRSLESFYAVIGEAINGPGGYFGSNLDALADCLSGGFGTPEGGYTIRWEQSAASRQALGHTETVRQLELRLERCHPDARPHVKEQLTQARRHEGPTVFDWLVEIINDAPNVCLELA
jgi:RNAse (barnase) inhibitor barstar